MFESDYDLAEKKLMTKFDEKMTELRETQRMDRNDYNNKLATFKADVSQQVFEPYVHNFLKDHVYNQWGGQKNRTKKIEAELEDL